MNVIKSYKTDRWLGSVCLSALLALSPNMLEAAEVEVGRPGKGDNYVCWGRVPVDVTFSAGESLPDKVVIESKPRNDAPNPGAVAFSLSRDSSEAPQETLEVSVDTASRTARFFLQGTRASEAWIDGAEFHGRDVLIEVRTEDGAVIGTSELMVRVRKNAQTLTDDERDIFLEAFKRAALKNNQFAKYWGLHQDAGTMIAHTTAFLPWHRVLLLNLERELQAEIPEASLPYWEFDEPADKVFNLNFMGRIGGLQNAQEVEFGVRNPLNQVQFSDPRIGLLTRVRNGDVNTDPDLNKTAIMNETSHTLMNAEIWYSYHGAAHNFVGGMIGRIGPSPADPLFFLLHANVDRAWAAWQRAHDRFDRNQATSYSLQGGHSPGANFGLGNYVEDTMWPWDHQNRPSLPNQTITVGLINLPPTVGAGEGAPSNPEVGDMIDYLDLNGNGVTHNYCYDMVPTGVGPVVDFP